MNCPSPEEIDAILDDSTPQKLEAFEAHVDGCVTCQQRLMSRSANAPWRSATTEVGIPESKKSVEEQDTDPGPFDTWSEARVDQGDSSIESTPRIPGYEIHQEIGRGGMAVVYRGHHRKLDRPVAIKVIAGHQNAGTGAWLRFHQEAKAVARLQHPNIIQVFDSGEPGGVPFVSQELASGGTLAAKIDHSPQPADDSARLLRTLADAVEYAHRQGIVHRDLKPSNVLFSSGVPKLADFGLAKIMGQDGGVTQTSDIMGSPRYMAPEQAAGRHDEVGPTSDVYALGVILYEMLTGSTPFNAITPVGTLRLVMEEDAVPVRQLNPDVPADLATICHKCLMKDPSRRYGSAAELSDDLGRYLEGEPILARPISLLERAWKWSRRHPSATGLVIVSTAALATLLIFWAVMTRKLSVQTDLAERKAAEAERSLEAEQDAHAAAEEVLRFISEDVFDAAVSRRGGRELTVADSIRTAMENLSGRFEDRPLVEATLRTTIGNSLQSLGMYTESADQLRQAVAMFTDLDARNELHYQSKLAFAIALKELGQLEESREQLEDLRDPTWPVDGRHRLQVRLSIADLLLKERNLAAAVPHLKQLLADCENQLGKEDSVTLSAAGQLAVATFMSGDLEAARNCFQRNVDELSRILGPDHVDTFNDTNNLAVVTQRLGDLDSAEKIHRDLLERKNRVLGPDHPGSLSTLYNLGSISIRRGNLEEALELFQGLIEKRKRVDGPVGANTLHAVHTTANVMIELEQLDEAVQFLAEHVDPYESEVRDEMVWGLIYLTYGRIHLLLEDADRAGDKLRVVRRIFESRPPGLRPANWDGLEKAEAMLNSLQTR